MLSIPLLTFSSSSAVLSGFVMLTEPLKLSHGIYSWILITRDYFALTSAPVFCHTALFQHMHGTALSFRALAKEWCFCCR